ncbi:MAG: hypothetical protein C0631_07570 [Sedimenticola sp.]|nr:MAG: hypothetical protein C0631_07570 [Sedimenticola sp.]
MKSIILKSISIALFVLGMQAVSLQAAESVLFLGDFCWRGQSNSVDQTTGTLKLGVTQIGSHFPVYGKLTTDEFALVVQGNAETTSQGIEVVLHGAGFNGMERIVTTYHLLLNGTLNGSYRSIGFESLGGMTPETMTDEGSLAIVPCN